MKYFKITDQQSEAWARCMHYLEERQQALSEIKELADELGVETPQGYIHDGTLHAFAYNDGDYRPTGMIIKKGMLVPNKRTDWGRGVAEKMEAIDVPDARACMATLFGVCGEVIIEGRHLYGCNLQTGKDMALVWTHDNIYENAKHRDGFDLPAAGLEAIDEDEWRELRDELEPRSEKKEESN